MIAALPAHIDTIELVCEKQCRLFRLALLDIAAIGLAMPQLLVLVVSGMAATKGSSIQTW